MQNAIAHHQLTDAQTVSEQQKPLANFPAVLLLHMMFHRMEYSFGHIK